MTSGDELLRLEHVSKRFGDRTGLMRRSRSHVIAVDSVNLTLHAGETVAVVGESGSGKSTLLRLAMNLLRPNGGRVLFRGSDLATATKEQQRDFHRQVQTVFQDSFAALDPRMTAGQSIAEPMVIHKSHDRRARGSRVTELLEMVGLRARDARRYPHEFSGGQRQRISIARALALGPQVLLLDEPVAALDVSTQAQVINLLADLQDQLGLAYLFVSHDLSIVHHICDRAIVMYLGAVVEEGSREELFQRPHHPYTIALLSAVPISDPTQRDSSGRIVLHGDLPDPFDVPSGCRFRTRCWKADERCTELHPPLAELHDETHHVVACHHPENSDVRTPTSKGAT